MLENIKLVIWDLDETFWKGTLSDGDVTPISDNLKIVKEFTDRGIINSICSKNDYNEAVSKLSSDDFRINDLFVFKSIDWSPKGERIKKIISDMNLRPINCLFIDDNISNLKEAQFELPELNVCLYSDFNTLIKDNPNSFKGKDDSSHSRLSQYKILEKKVKDKELVSSNDKFLRQSNIRVLMIEDNLDLNRIHEMIHRNNQLNFTKNRIDFDEVKEIFLDKNIKSGVVQVIDKYGDNGIVGCYALKEGTLIQFVFSCRILGMGVEKYVYQQLGYPNIEIKGVVASTLIKGEKIDYINQSIEIDKKELNANYPSKNMTKRFIAYGECPLRPIWAYLQPQLDNCKFNEITPNPSVLNLGRMFFLNDEQKAQILSYLPSVTNREWIYDKDIKDGNFDYLLISLINECTNYRYFNPHNNTIFYSRKIDSNLVNLNQFVESPVTLDDIKVELHNLITNIPQNAVLFILTSSEIIFKARGKDYDYDYSILSNKILDEFASKFKNIKLIDIRKYAKYESDFFEPVRNHYNREIGYHLAHDVINHINSTNGSTNNIIKDKLPNNYISGTLFIENTNVYLEYIFYICNFKLHFELKNIQKLNNEYSINLKLHRYREELLSVFEHTIDIDIYVKGDYRVVVTLSKNNNIILKKPSQNISFDIYSLPTLIDPEFHNYSGCSVIMPKFISKIRANNKFIERQINQLNYLNTSSSFIKYFSKILNINEINLYFDNIEIAKIIVPLFEKSDISIKNIYSSLGYTFKNEFSGKVYKLRPIENSTNISSNEYVLLCALSPINPEVVIWRRNIKCNLIWLDYALAYVLTNSFTTSLVNKYPESLFIALKTANLNYNYVDLTPNESKLSTVSLGDIIQNLKSKKFNLLPPNLQNYNHKFLEETLLEHNDIFDFSKHLYIDLNSDYLNIENGIRKTIGQPEFYLGTIYIIGDSKTFGIGVSDENTVASILQKSINLPYRVVNYAVCYNENNLIDGINMAFNSIKLNKNDIVVFIFSSVTDQFNNQYRHWISWDGLNQEFVKIDCSKEFRGKLRPDYFVVKEGFSPEFNKVLANNIKNAIYNNIQC